MSTLVGREAEKAVLKRALESREPELVAVYGRRRVGKTFLVREFFAGQLVLELTGVHDAKQREQLANFAGALRRSAGGGVSLPVPTSWREAFEQLTIFLERSPRRGKRVVFLDEFPWLASRRSGCLQAFDYFWNSWASRQNDLIVVICGSAASWMIRKVVHHRGGLHNRITRHVCLQPFTLGETASYLTQQRVELGLRQVLELYMVMGGIPHYLKEIQRGRSAAQNIDSICFSRTGLLRDEFERLYASLFEHAHRHVDLVRALAKKRSGLTRNEILAVADRETGGGITNTLEDLAQSGFLMRTAPFGKGRKDTLYRLADEYSLFYLKWIEKHRSGGADTWLKKQSSGSWKAWSGYAFETICLKHILQLKRALGIAAVDTEESSWQYRPKTDDETGAQIDLLIDRRDDCINLCEMKFSEGEFVIDKKYAAVLRNKRETFRRITNTRKTLLLTMVTTRGVRDNAHCQELITNSITMDELFS